MKIRGSLALKLCLCVVATAPAALPSTPTLTAAPGSVVFQYNPPEAPPLAVFVNVTASNATSPTLAVTVIPGPGTPATLFPAPAVVGDKIQVSYDSTTFDELAVQPPATYTATYAVSSAGFTTLNIPITLTIGPELTVIPSAAQLNFYVPGPTSQVIALTGDAGATVGLSVAWNTFGGGNWLTATLNQTQTPASLTVSVSSVNVPVGTYLGTVTVTPTTGTLIQLVIPISLQVGTNTLTANPSSFTFSYNVGGTVPAPQVLQLTSTAASNDTYVAQAVSLGNWLLLNGVTSNIAGTLPATPNVTVNPVGLLPGTYQGTITATDSENGTQVVNVTLMVTALSQVANPDSLVFVAQTQTVLPAAQPLAINGFGAATFTATVNGAWLSVSATSGAAPTQILVSANPAGLAVGTYSGSIIINLDTHIQTVKATLIVSDKGVLTTDTGGFVIYYEGGNEAPAPMTLNVTVSNTASQSFAYVAGLPAWLQISSASTTLVAPGPLTVTVAPQTLPTGFYLAQVILYPVDANSDPIVGGIAIVVPVFLVVSNAPGALPNIPAMSFTAIAGGGPQSQNVEITASSAVSFTTSTNESWLSVSPASATANLVTQLSVTADASKLAAGTYQGVVTMTTTAGVTTQITVAFTVTTGNVPFTVSPTTLTFAYTQNGTVPVTQVVQVTGSQAFTAVASAITGGEWLTVTPGSGTGSVALNVGVSPASLATGTYSGTITVTPTGGTAQTVAVTLTVSPAVSSFSATPSSLTFAYSGGGSAPAAQLVSIAATGAIPFTAASNSTWLTVSPSSATTPAFLTVSVNATNLPQGTYNGLIALSGSDGSLQLSINVTLNVTSALPAITKVVNAASYAQGGIAPGEIVTIFGTALGPVTGVGATIDSKGYIETLLSNVQVTFNGYPAPILYASAGQINAIAPYELTGYATVSVEALFGTARSNPVTLPVEAAAPGIFSANASGQGGGAILDLNYHLVSASNPTAAGSIIQVFATGQGQTMPGGVDGLIEPLSLPLPAPLLDVTASIGGVAANLEYFGDAPGLVAGALQVNITVPSGVAAGAAPLFITVGGISSQTGITVAVQ